MENAAATNVTSDSAAFNSHEQFRNCKIATGVEGEKKREERLQVTASCVTLLRCFDYNVAGARRIVPFDQMQFESIIHGHHPPCWPRRS